MLSRLIICQRMHWTYDELLALPEDVYDVLVTDLNRAAARNDTQHG